MLELARFRRPEPARLVMRVLEAEGIAARTRDEQGETVLYLVDASRFDEARRLLDAFLADPASRRFQQVAWEASEPQSAATPKGSVLPGGWWASQGPVTRVIFVLSVLVFLSPPFFGDGVYRALLFADSPRELLGEPWRLFSPMLLHLGWLHIIFNLLWWLELGRVIERFQSSLQLLWITLLAAAVSNSAQFFATGPNFGGLSGVVYGLLGYLWLYGKTNPGAGYGLRPEIVMFMLAWLVIAMTGIVGPVANTAHFAGLATGCVLGALTGWWRSQARGD